jgi:hypothetical protein
MLYKNIAVLWGLGWVGYERAVTNVVRSRTLTRKTLHRYSNTTFQLTVNSNYTVLTEIFALYYIQYGPLPAQRNKSHASYRL